MNVLCFSLCRHSQSIKDSQISEMQDRVKPHLDAGELEAHRNIILFWPSNNYTNKYAEKWAWHE